MTTLDRDDHETLAQWAADCAERVLSCFETQYPDDSRPRDAIELARAWVRGELAVHEARAAAFTAHAAARQVDDLSAQAAARAAGHAAATAHVAGHARHAAAYAVKAVAYSDGAPDTEFAVFKDREWQILQLPEHLRSVARAP